MRSPARRPQPHVQRATLRPDFGEHGPEVVPQPGRRGVARSSGCLARRRFFRHLKFSHRSRARYGAASTLPVAISVPLSLDAVLGPPIGQRLVARQAHESSGPGLVSPSLFHGSGKVVASDFGQEIGEAETISQRRPRIHFLDPQEPGGARHEGLRPRESHCPTRWRLVSECSTVPVHFQAKNVEAECSLPQEKAASSCSQAHWHSLY